MGDSKNLGQKSRNLTSYVSISRHKTGGEDLGEEEASSEEITPTFSLHSVKNPTPVHKTSDRNSEASGDSLTVGTYCVSPKVHNQPEPMKTICFVKSNKDSANP